MSLNQDLFALEPWEIEDAGPVPLQPACAIDVAVDSDHCVVNHRLDVQVSEAGQLGPRLKVSRYYWDLDPPVAVDFVRELLYGEQELAAKKAYCEKHGIRYILVKDIWDGESVEAELSKYQQDSSRQKNGKLLVGPRRSKGERP